MNSLWPVDRTGTKLSSCRHRMVSGFLGSSVIMPIKDAGRSSRHSLMELHRK